MQWSKKIKGAGDEVAVNCITQTVIIFCVGLYEKRTGIKRTEISLKSSKMSPLMFFTILTVFFYMSNVQPATVSPTTELQANQKNETACKDDERCDYYWSRGWYTCNVGAVLYDYCKKSCGLCDKTPIPTVPPGEPCRDFEPRCPKWAKYRECIYTKTFTEKYCPKSCKACGKDRTVRKFNLNCVDKSYLCKTKEKQHGCLFQRKFMAKHCKRTCKMCTPYSRCNDKDSLCNWWAKKKNYCASKRFKVFMKKKCRFSCDLCDEEM